MRKVKPHAKQDLSTSLNAPDFSDMKIPPDALDLFGPIFVLTLELGDTDDASWIDRILS